MMCITHSYQHCTKWVQPKHKIRALCFDMDGVVVDSMDAHAQCWIDVFREYGVVLDKVDIFKREGMTGIESIEDIFIEKKAPLPPREKLIELQRKKMELFANYEVSIYPHIDTLISYLRSKNVKLGIVTGSFKHLVEKLIPDNILAQFDAIVAVDDVHRGKPYPDPYLQAVRQLSVDKDSTIVVENAPMGIKAAKAAGLFCIAICTTLDASYLQEADVIVNDHDELIKYLYTIL